MNSCKKLDWFLCRFRKMGGVNINDFYKAFNYKLKDSEISSTVRDAENVLGIRIVYFKFAYVSEENVQQITSSKVYTI